MRDVAKAAGVSRAAVSFALLGTGAGNVGVAPKTIKRIEQVAKRMKYRPNLTAQQLKGKSSHSIGVLISTALDSGHVQILQGAERVLESEGYLAVVGHTHDDPKIRRQYIDEFLYRNVDGVICTAVAPNEGTRELSRIQRQSSNVVYYPCSWPLHEQAHLVDVDRAAPTTLAVRYLHAQGHERIGLVLWADHPADQARRRGYVRGLEEVGIEPNEQLVHVHGQWTREQPSEKACERAVDRLVEQQKVHAIVAYQDSWALGLIRELRRRGLSVPGDVAVVGIENHPMGSLMDPQLTTVDPRYELVGQSLARMLLRMLREGPLSPGERQVIIQPELVVRQSA